MRPTVHVQRHGGRAIVSAPVPVSLDAAGLRDLAARCAALADELDPPVRVVASVLSLRPEPRDAPDAGPLKGA